MSKLHISLAFSDCDRVAALANGQVQPDGIDLNFLTLPVEETFFRMARHRATFTRRTAGSRSRC